MRDFLIKLLGGYKAVVVIVEKHPHGVKMVSNIVNFYPFVQMIYKTRLGIITFNKDKSVRFMEQS